MSELMLQDDPYLSLPLDGVRLIEASAGTGKTFTPPRCSPGWWWSRATASARSPAVTFTDAATQELRKRIRERGAGRAAAGARAGRR